MDAEWPVRTGRAGGSAGERPLPAGAALAPVCRPALLPVREGTAGQGYASWPWRSVGGSSSTRMGTSRPGPLRLAPLRPPIPASWPWQAVARNPRGREVYLSGGLGQAGQRCARRLLRTVSLYGTACAWVAVMAAGQGASGEGGPWPALRPWYGGALTRPAQGD